MKSIITAVLVCLFSWTTFAQDLPLSPDVQRAIRKNTRTTNGKPGKAYWQNSADYKIRVKFEPETRLLSGTVAIVYQNNSPDTLKEALFKIYPNLFQRNAVRATRIAASDQTDGMKIQSLQVNDRPEPRYKTEGTNMTVPLTDVLPGQAVRFNVTYSYTLNKGSHVRTGQVDPGAFFIAYFFPRVAVYDDIDGWNNYPYRGSEEFYNDFCNFEAEITVPEGFAVWATGDLLNAGAVFKPAIANRLAKAELENGIVDVITQGDLDKREVTLAAPGTWKFKAANVVDFAFATSNHYIWKSTSLVVDPVTNRRTRVDAVFNPEHKDYYEVVDFARKTVEVMSYSFPKWPFPYAHETVFDGLDRMEYPMMVNDIPTKPREDAITLTDHEVFHTMFPFYMGTNETKHGWMDEGWATLGEWLVSKKIDSVYVDEYGVAPTAQSAGKPGEQPILTLTPELKGIGSFTNTYPKPAMGYLYVMDLLGEELFTKALHYYIRQWNGKHPIPSDFFNAMNEGAGKNLNWFWKRWFFDDGGVNQAISGVTEKNGKFDVRVSNPGGKPMPVDLTVHYRDGSTEQVHRSIAVWEKGDPAVEITFKTIKPVVKIVLGSTYIPDSDTGDNQWTR